MFQLQQSPIPRSETQSDKDRDERGMREDSAGVQLHSPDSATRSVSPRRALAARARGFPRIRAGARARCTHTSVLHSTRQRNFSIIMTSWDARISSLLFSPTQFLSRTTSEMFLAELLDNLRDDKTNDSKKILLLSVFLEHPTVLCTTTSAGEQTAHELVSILNCTPQKSDTNDNVGGPTHHAVRAGACECLREMETCQPGLLSQKLEALYYLKQQETTVLHQSYCMLYTEVLKNAIRFLTQEKDVDNAKLRAS
ncbi:hypothetical protein HF521_008420 [Silurus meridionalis]|uniref:AP-5 complex subunit beta-1 N-terminal domain-containing protein n=1 Tax=Silurus meridionalis TaxID=175797 RepID=A0A8T0AMP9_SILME|nr:hypothetical protein HF521_008420 [Silurus meridionalis]